jgi:ComF family protein
MARVIDYKQSLINWFFPSSCLLCCNITSSNAGLCQYCLDDLPLLDLTQSPNLLNHPDIVEMFPTCEFDFLIACGFYQPPFQHWLTQLKFNNQIHFKVALQQVINQQMRILFKQLNIAPPDGFVILPLHASRFLSRGFNQVSQVWSPCIKHYGPIIDCLKRNKKTQPQSSLSKSKRIKNLQGAFICKQNMEGKTIAIIDDVMTTGATLNAATQALKQAGAKQVWAFVTCLTPI